MDRLTIYLVKKRSGGGEWLDRDIEWNPHLSDAQVFIAGAALNAVCEDLSAVAIAFEAKA